LALFALQITTKRVNLVMRPQGGSAQETAMSIVEFRRQLEGYGLTTANILYGMPDHPTLLQTYVWQSYDLAPRFPRLREFLDFWARELDGPLHSVRVAHKRLIGPREVRTVTTELSIH
jgi:uncharacterized protein Usg